MKAFTALEMYYNSRKEFQYTEDESGALVITDVPENLAEFYPENYHCHSVLESFDDKGLKYRATKQRDLAVLLNKKRSIGGILNLIKPVPEIFKVLSKCNLTLNSKIIDLGCGGGTLLFQLGKLGFTNLKGVDPYLPSALEAIEKLDFVQSSIKEVNGKYDLIILNHVLEHIYDQEDILEHVKGLMHEGSRLLVRIPLYKSKAWKLYNVNWFQLDAPRHLKVQSVESFKALLSKLDLNLLHTIFDSVPNQFLRSELYKRNVSSKAFFDKFNGDIRNVFSKDEIRYWKKLTQKVNRTGEADQASFIISKS
jgi:SAM-dependent methyltransferase